MGIPTAAGSTDRNIPPLVHIPAPVVSRVLYGGQGFTGGHSTLVAVAAGPLVLLVASGAVVLIMSAVAEHNLLFLLWGL